MHYSIGIGMGNQQILLIVLGMIIVGIAISIALILMRENAISSNRDAIATDLLNIAVRAEQYYKTPISTGGGGHSYIGLTADRNGMLKLGSEDLISNDNGTYTIRTAGNSSFVILQGVGNVELTDGTFPILSCRVSRGQAIVTIEN